METVFKKSSKYIGVTKVKSSTKRKWRAQQVIDGKQTHLGTFNTELDAAKCVNVACERNGMELKNPELSDVNFELTNSSSVSQHLICWFKQFWKFAFFKAVMWDLVKIHIFQLRHFHRKFCQRSSSSTYRPCEKKS